ncbi:uncharacterized protein MYCFIDRAFT_195277 [Pseudocercospora fijiensis CIRAD86]|uniref:MYND-type domain-containing protein n=1 Tax=Pseudocercospora fijiensis (strain CIRAD86) TaxID=383855 RepID=M2Z2R0_PSEFD|nr:uncharacterized protein MYCFIDRAFT_195277 [Pseudocercospora fijiensis CIRAD86]EME84140.1 hypothetical protein MYCFIDRAFT_195277 [Pseudocercospora fijiensis CIRAD86]
MIKREPAVLKKDESEIAINYSMFQKLCSHPEKVRAYLDSSGALSKRFTALRKEARTSKLEWTRDPYGPGYIMCMLGACAMTLGARLSVLDLEGMRKYYKNCGLMRDAVNGSPWDFGSIGRDENMARGGAAKEDLIYPGCGMTNIWAPDHGRQQDELKFTRSHVMKAIAVNKPNADDLAQTLASLFFDPYASPVTTISATKADSRPQDFIDLAREMLEGYKKVNSKPPKSNKDECAVCEAGEYKDGKPLMTCSKCKRSFYCSKECQKKDWKKHKISCSLFGPTEGNSHTTLNGIASLEAFKSLNSDKK